MYVDRVLLYVNYGRQMQRTDWALWHLHWLSTTHGGKVVLSCYLLSPSSPHSQPPHGGTIVLPCPIYQQRMATPAGGMNGVT